MAFRQALSEWLSIIIKIGIIGVVTVGIVWLCLSGYGNWKLAQENKPPPDPPDVTDDYDEILIKTTNQKFYSEDCDRIQSEPWEIYRITGYYELSGKKWQYRDIVLFLNEEYYGDIIVKRR